MFGQWLYTGWISITVSKSRVPNLTIMESKFKLKYETGQMANIGMLKS